MKTEERKKYNKGYAIKSAIKSMLVLLALIIFLLYIGNSLLPTKVTDYFWRYSWIIFLYLIYSGYRNYQNLKEFLDDSLHIQLIKEKYRFPIAEFKEVVAITQVFLAVVEKKIDIAKFFTPIPFIVYGIGVYVDDKVFLQKTTDLFGNIIIYKDLMIYGGFICFGLYLLGLNRLLERHKQLSLRIVRFQSELFFYEELLLSEEKVRKKEYIDTIKSILD